MRVLVTGGSRGIGAALVRAFCARGDRVAFCYRASSAAAAALAHETGATALAVDLSDSVARARLVPAAAAALGGSVEVLVNNAGVALTALSRDTSDADFARVMETDLAAAFALSREVQPEMIRAGFGRIVNVGSMWGKVGASCEVAYSAAKAGLRGLTMALAKELGPSGITVNCVEPGVINTEMNAALTPSARAALVDETPLCRIGTPADVAAAVLFFASPEAGFVTGQCLGVDGGFAIG